MVFDSEKRIVQKYKAKPGIHSLGEALARQLFPFTEATVNDVIEQLFVIEASKYQLLEEKEFKDLQALLTRGNRPATTASKSTPPSFLPLGIAEKQGGQ